MTNTYSEILSKIPFRVDGILFTSKISEELKQEIIICTPFIEDTSDSAFKIRVYCIKNNLTEIPKCKCCENKVKWAYTRSKFNKFCSISCSSKKFQSDSSYIDNNREKYSKTLQDKKQTLQNELLELQKNNNYNWCTSIKEYQYCLRNNINEAPKCEICKSLIKFSNGYAKTCSRGCSSKLGILNKRDETSEFSLDNLRLNGILRTNISNEHYKILEEMTPFIIGDRKKTLQQRVYCVENNITETPKCKCCENKVKWSAGTHVFNTFCSRTCANEFNKSVQSISKAKDFQERRNEEGYDYKGIVYIVHFEHLRAIKIGITNNFASRSKALKDDFGNFNILNLIETESCFTLEREYHQKFDNYRICLEKGSGRTEFFAEKIIEFL